MVFCLILILALDVKGLELVLTQGEIFSLNLDDLYQLDVANYTVDPAFSSEYEIEITPRYSIRPYNYAWNFIKILEKPSSVDIFVGLERDRLLLFTLDISDWTFRTLNETDLSRYLDGINCRSMAFLNASLALECFANETTIFLVFEIKELIGVDSSWTFEFKNMTVPDFVPEYMLDCDKNKFWGSDIHLFYFCPFYSLIQMGVSKQEARNNTMVIYELDPTNNILTRSITLYNRRFQDIIEVYKNFYVILDYQNGLLIYVFKDLDNFIFETLIPLPEANYLYIAARTKDSVYPDQIQNFLYVASQFNVLEVLFTGPKAIIYSKNYQLYQKNATMYDTEELMVTPSYVVVLQKSLEDGLETMGSYVMKVFSSDLGRMSSLHFSKEIKSDFLRGFIFNYHQEINDYVVLSFPFSEDPDGNKVYNIIQIADSTLKITCCKISLEAKLNSVLNLTVNSTYNKPVSFTNQIPIYLLPINYTDLTFRVGYQKQYPFLDNYFEIPLNAIALGSNIDYFYLGNGLYDGSADSNIGNVFMDYQSNFIIRDDDFSSDVILEGFMDFQSKALILLIHSPSTHELFNLFCTDYDYSDRVINKCEKEEPLLFLNRIDYIKIDKDLLFIYSRDDPYQFYVCESFERKCGGSPSPLNSTYDEILYINEDLIIGRLAMSNGMHFDLFSMRYRKDENSKNPYALLDVTIEYKTSIDWKDFEPTVLKLDASLIDFNILAIRTSNKLIFFQVTSYNYTSYKFLRSFDYDIVSDCQIVLLRMGIALTVCASSNQIIEYRINNPYDMSFSREYPTFWYVLQSAPEPSTDQKYLYVAAIDTRNNDTVLLIYNPSAVTCELLIKICALTHYINKFIPIQSTLHSYSLVYLLPEDVSYDELKIVNTSPFLYGNFSNSTFEKLYYNKSLPYVQFDLMFSNGGINLVTSLYVDISMNGSHLTRSAKYLNENTLTLDENYVVDNYYTFPVEEFFDGPIESMIFQTKQQDFPFVFEDIINKNQDLAEYETSRNFFSRTIDMTIFNDTIIVITEKLLVFLINERSVFLLHNETASFDYSCQIAHHDKDLYFMVSCPGPENQNEYGKLYLFTYELDNTKIRDLLSRNESLLSCGDCILVNKSITPLEQYGRIKRLILKGDLYFFLSYMINNRNQENFTIGNLSILRKKKTLAFTQISAMNSFQASDFNLLYFKTRDFDVKLGNSSGMSSTFIVVFILNSPIPVVQNNKFLAAQFTISVSPNGSSTVTLDRTLVTSEDDSPEDGNPLAISLLSVSRELDNVTAIVSTTRVFKEFSFDFQARISVSYTYNHYHRCENTDAKPIFFKDFLIGICKRIDNGENNPEVLPIFRDSINYTTILIYRKNQEKNVSNPIRMITSFLAEDFPKKFLIFTGERPNGKKITKIMVSNPFNFLTVYELYPNVTFWPKRNDIPVNQINGVFKGSLLATNKFDNANITFVFHGKKDKNINRILIYVIFGLLMGLGFMLMLAFLFFAISKKVEEKIEASMRISTKIGNSRCTTTVMDTNILTGSIQHRLSIQRMKEKEKAKGKKMKSLKKTRVKEKV